MLSAAFSIAARTLGRGPCTVSLLAILIAPGTVLPGVYAGRSASSGRRRAVTRPVYESLTCALPSPIAPVYAVGSAVNVRRRARAAEWGSLLMSCRPQRRPEVQILSPPPWLTCRPHNLMTCARSSTDRASDYGSEGWEFESLRARHQKHLLPALSRISLRAVNHSEAFSVTWMSQDSSNLCAKRVSARRDNLPQRCAGGAQCVVLRVGIDARRDRGVGVAQPLGDDGHRHTP